MGPKILDYSGRRTKCCLPNPKANRSWLVLTMCESAGGYFLTGPNLDEYPVACHFTQWTCIAGFHAQAV